MSKEIRDQEVSKERKATKGNRGLMARKVTSGTKENVVSLDQQVWQDSKDQKDQR